jgi:hypothetical protein
VQNQIAESDHGHVREVTTRDTGYGHNGDPRSLARQGRIAEVYAKILCSGARIAYKSAPYESECTHNKQQPPWKPLLDVEDDQPKNPSLKRSRTESRKAPAGL